MKSKQLAHLTAIVAIGLVCTAAGNATPPPLPVFETVQGFPLGPQQPACKTIRDAAGNTYGTTYNGGANRAGTVFKVKPNGDIITLHHFDITQGTQPTGLTVGNDGNFYGATMSGGASNAGTFFKITPTGVFTQLHEFTEATDGSMPVSRLLKGTDGNFYGTTFQGGANGLGTFYRVTPAGALTVLVHWNNDSVGWGPNGDLVQATDGNFYGTNRSVNIPGQEETGTVYRITPGGTATALATFASLPDMISCLPDGLIQASDGNFYGTTFYGGPDQAGTVFKVTPTGTLSQLAQFSSDGNRQPMGALTEGSDGSLYGTSHYGGTHGNGTIFKITKAGAVTTLLNMVFPGNGPAHPSAGLVKGPNESFYGTCMYGGAYGRGTFFKLDKHGRVTVVTHFYGDEPHAPDSALLQTRDGDFYGTTTLGGYTAERTVFRMAPNRKISTASDLPSDPNYMNQFRPAFVEGKRGIIFGTQLQGGMNLVGSVFKLDRRHRLSNLLSFNGADGDVTGGLILGTDDNLYGTNYLGGSLSGGTLFRMTQSGQYSLVAEFDEQVAGRVNPGLTQGADGNFYGTTQSGGSNNNGTVFKVTPAGTVSTFAEFGDPELEGRAGNAGLIQGSDGNFYGLLPWGGPSDAGAIYKVSTGGVVTTLATFTYANGGIPAGLLTEGPDGAFYGVTTHGGPTDNGTVFRITSGGDFATVFNFDSTHGRKPLAGLTKGKDGALYGATSEGGVMADGTPAGGGQIYRLRFPASCD